MRETALNHLRQRDRADLAVLLGAVNGANAALKRDQHGDPVIAGSRGTIRSCNGSFSIHVACRSRRRWHFVKQAMANFCTIAQDGDDEGVLQLNRLPVGEEAARLRDVIGLRQHRPTPSARADHLAPFRFSTPSEGEINANYSPKAEGGYLTTPHGDGASAGRAGRSWAASGDQGGAT
jgi:hypothetical protein